MLREKDVRAMYKYGVTEAVVDVIGIDSEVKAFMKGTFEGRSDQASSTDDNCPPCSS